LNGCPEKLALGSRLWVISHANLIKDHQLFFGLLLDCCNGTLKILCEIRDILAEDWPQQSTENFFCFEYRLYAIIRS
jgi:hypothetical protein